MEYVRGATLQAYIEEVAPGRIPIDEAVGYLQGIARALAATHLHGRVHRDLKPLNLMVIREQDIQQPADRVRMLDFGLALKIRRSGRAESQEGTASGESVGRPEDSPASHAGTPEYMAPEGFEGANDFRSDIYSFGVTAYEVLSGQRPWTCAASGPERVHAWRRLHETAPPRPLREARPATPRWLSNVVMRCLEKDPARRWATAEELKRRLRPPISPWIWRSIAATAVVIAVLAVVTVKVLLRPKPELEISWAFEASPGVELAEAKERSSVVHAVVLNREEARREGSVVEIRIQGEEPIRSLRMPVTEETTRRLREHEYEWEVLEPGQDVTVSPSPAMKALEVHSSSPSGIPEGTLTIKGRRLNLDVDETIEGEVHLERDATAPEIVEVRVDGADPPRYLKDPFGSNTPVRFRRGARLTVRWKSDGCPVTATLERDDGVAIPLDGEDPGGGEDGRTACFSIDDALSDGPQNQTVTLVLRDAVQNESRKTLSFLVDDRPPVKFTENWTVRGQRIGVECTPKKTEQTAIQWWLKVGDEEKRSLEVECEPLGSEEAPTHRAWFEAPKELLNDGVVLLIVEDDALPEPNRAEIDVGAAGLVPQVAGPEKVSGRLTLAVDGRQARFDLDSRHFGERGELAAIRLEESPGPTVTASLELRCDWDGDGNEYTKLASARIDREKGPDDAKIEEGRALWEGIELAVDEDTELAVTLEDSWGRQTELTLRVRPDATEPELDPEAISWIPEPESVPDEESWYFGKKQLRTERDIRIGWRNEGLRSLEFVLSREDGSSEPRSIPSTAPEQGANEAGDEAKTWKARLDFPDDRDDGHYRLGFIAVDLAGHDTTEPLSRTLVIDTRPPKIDGFRFDAEADAVTFQVTDTSDVERIQARLVVGNGQPEDWVTVDPDRPVSSDTYRLELAGHGLRALANIRRVDVRARDRLGQSDEPESWKPEGPLRRQADRVFRERFEWKDVTWIRFRDGDPKAPEGHGYLYLSSCEVSRGLYTSWPGWRGQETLPLDGDDDHPVRGLSGVSAQAFAEAHFGEFVRLPTVAEWTAAASWATKPDGPSEWIRDNESRLNLFPPADGVQPVDPGPNATDVRGLLHLFGNVAEMVTGGDTGFRCMGGSHQTTPTSLMESACRDRPLIASDLVGFRLLLDPERAPREVLLKIERSSLAAPGKERRERR